MKTKVRELKIICLLGRVSKILRQKQKPMQSSRDRNIYINKIDVYTQSITNPSYHTNINIIVATDWKRSVFIPILKKGNVKECSNYSTIALILHASEVMLKIHQARLQQYMNHELPVVQAGFRKGRGTRDQMANIRWVIEKENSRKTSISALLTMPKPLTVWITINCGKFFKRWEYQTT